MSVAEMESPDGSPIEPRSTLAAVPDRSAVLEIVRDATSVIPVTTDEVFEVANSRPDRAPRLLAASAIDNMMRAKGPAGQEAPPPGIRTYLEYEAAKKHLAGVTGNSSTGMRPKKRASLQEQYKADRDKAHKAAAGFIGLVAVVDSFAGDLQNELSRSDNRIDWLGTLYDKTDELDHPALRAFPPLRKFGDKNPRREAVVEGDRLLRFILQQAVEGV